MNAAFTDLFRITGGRSTSTNRALEINNPFENTIPYYCITQNASLSTLDEASDEGLEMNFNIPSKVIHRIAGTPFCEASGGDYGNSSGINHINFLSYLESDTSHIRKGFDETLQAYSRSPLDVQQTHASPRNKQGDSPSTPNDLGSPESVSHDRNQIMAPTTSPQ